MRTAYQEKLIARCTSRERPPGPAQSPQHRPWPKTVVTLTAYNLSKPPQNCWLEYLQSLLAPFWTWRTRINTHSVVQYQAHIISLYIIFIRETEMRSSSQSKWQTFQIGASLVLPVSERFFMLFTSDWKVIQTFCLTWFCDLCEHIQIASVWFLLFNVYQKQLGPSDTVQCQPLEPLQS